MLPLAVVLGLLVYQLLRDPASSGDDAPVFALGSLGIVAGVASYLGFSPLAASGLSLIANTAPVAYGALGTPVIALAASEQSHRQLSARSSGSISRRIGMFAAFCLRTSGSG